MSRFRVDIITTAAAWILAAPVAGSWLPELSHRQTIDLSGLAKKLSPTAKIYYPGSAGFEAASSRWSVLDEPKVNVVVVPGTENDVAETVILPFLHQPGDTGRSLGAMNGLLIVINSGDIRKSEGFTLPRVQWRARLHYHVGSDGSRH
jgi:hypothetical protein